MDDYIEDDNEYNSNVVLFVTDGDWLLKLKRYIKNNKSNISNFSIGIIFYYWKYYKNNYKEIEKKQENYNINDYNGYKIVNLFIKQKYFTFKNEILNYGYITMSEYYELVILKANKYFATSKGRKLQAKNAHGWVHYDIIEGAPITIGHLIAIILYCNFSDLCTSFSSTFRKKK
eukprot:494859_1